MVSIKLFAAIVAVIPLASCLSLEEIKETPEFEQLLLIPGKYPVFVEFVKKVYNRYQEQHAVSDADLFRLEIFLMGLQFQFVEFVNSPKFFEVADKVKEQIRKVAIPVLGLIPMDDLAKLADNIEQNPELQMSLAQDLEDISEIFFTIVTKQRIKLLELEASKLGGDVVNTVRRIARRVIEA